MDKEKFNKLLFEVACCAVACDGKIDEREVREIEYIEKTTPYFKNIKLENELDDFIKSFKENSKTTINNIIYQIKNNFLSQVESMLILEIGLRLMYADTKIEKKEIDLLKEIRSVLNINDVTIVQRFGKIDFLLRESTIDFKVNENTHKSIGRNTQLDIDKLNLDE